MSGMNIAFFGSSLVSAYWNGAATYYRGIIRALHARGHRVTFYEPDAYSRQQNRDIEDPSWAKVVVYPVNDQTGVLRALESAAEADVIVKASGVGAFDEFLEAAVLETRRRDGLAIFWDVDAPATLDRVQSNQADPFRPLIPRYDMIFTYGGGTPVVSAYLELGAKACVPIYNALDPDTHYPVVQDSRFSADLGFLGNRLPDREARVEEFFLQVAALLPERNFLLGGSGWHDKALPSNVKYVGHVYTRDHNSFNCSPLAVLNISRLSMARYGFSPATRVFEAAGAAACLMTDAWEGVEQFFEPEREILVAHNGAEVAASLKDLTADRARSIGRAAYRRALAEHTYSQRAAQVEAALCQSKPAVTISSESNGKSNSKVHSLNIVFLGLTLTSSWGNGHATTYRGLIRELTRRGHEVLFLERDRPWYADNRDMPNPDFSRVELYHSVSDLKNRFSREIARADLVVLGSYVPDGVEIGEWLVSTAKGTTAIYDIDTPITISKFENGEYEYLSPYLIPRFSMYLSFTGGPMLTRLETEFRSPMARALYCSVDPEIYYHEKNAAADDEFDLGYIGTYSADRQPSLERFLLGPARHWKQGRFIVAGPQYPDYIQWPGNIERIEHLAPDRHRWFYNHQRFTLNITRRDMITAGYSPSVRLFEAAVCGTPIISDNWNGISEFFKPDEEILIVNSTEEVEAILKNTSESAWKSIGECARRHVLAKHTAAHRAQQLEEYFVQAQH